MLLGGSCCASLLLAMTAAAEPEQAPPLPPVERSEEPVEPDAVPSPNEDESDSGSEDAESPTAEEEEPPTSEGAVDTPQEPVSADRVTPPSSVATPATSSPALASDSAAPAASSTESSGSTQVSSRIKSWRQRYDAARQALIEGRDDDAAREFRALAVAAPTYEDRILAEELAEVARTRSVQRRLVLEPPDLRTDDEMSLLYTTAFLYGFGTSGWLALQTKPQNVGAAVLPFIAITTATVGGVALVDDYKPFRYGVPQTISAGVYMGAGQGVWLVGYQHARATRRDDDSHFKSETVSTILWTGATTGAVVGGLLGAWKSPTPGEVSFGTSTMLWGGLLSSFLGAAATPNEDYSSENAFITGAVGYNLGFAAGVLWGPVLSPSVGRVRFVDLGGLAGGLVGVGGYLLAAGDNANPRAGLATTAVGSALGLGLAWWGTQGMDLDAASTDNGASVVPHVTPVAGGAVVGVSGSL